MKFLDDWLAETDGHANSYPGWDKTAAPSAMRGLFVMGTDTDVGKSYVSDLVIRHLVSRGVVVGAYKPVASGIDTIQDGDPASCGGPRAVAGRSTGFVPKRSWLPSAALAAQRQSARVDDRLLRTGAQWWQNHCELLVVEGAGGVMSPLSDQSTVLDLAGDLKHPVVLVAAIGWDDEPCAVGARGSESKKAACFGAGGQ